jgi:hypothetical protein
VVVLTRAVPAQAIARHIEVNFRQIRWWRGQLGWDQWWPQSEVVRRGVCHSRGCQRKVVRNMPPLQGRRLCETKMNAGTPQRCCQGRRRWQKGRTWFTEGAPEQHAHKKGGVPWRQRCRGRQEVSEWQKPLFWPKMGAFGGPHYEESTSGSAAMTWFAISCMYLLNVISGTDLGTGKEESVGRI